MTDKGFFNSLSGSTHDVVQEFLRMMSELRIDYCLIGGLAVNAYADPVVSLDFDTVIAIGSLDTLKKKASQEFRLEVFPHSINLNSPHSNLRIQIQTDSRYQDFIKRAVTRSVMGYDFRVASLEDVLQGKLWAWSDATRRPSKRQKDLADILRLVETHPPLREKIPGTLRAML